MFLALLSKSIISLKLKLFETNVLFFFFLSLFYLVSISTTTTTSTEEEIDVVSVGDKNLPTNPSARDRRALQNKITSRMVKTSAGNHTIPRRRISNGSSDDSAYASKGSPEIASPNTNSPIRLVASNGSRKRVSQAAAAAAASATTTAASTPNAKRSKLSKKVNASSSSSSSTPNGRASSITTQLRRSQIVDSNGDEIETIEKRNLHNDMERQRRIGLKNLFENLKDKIPSLREKERAPKVNILREATILCTKLTQEDREYEQQLKRRHRLQQRLKYLREQAAAAGIY